MNILMGFIYASSGRSRVLGYEPGDVRAKRAHGRFSAGKLRLLPAVSTQKNCCNFIFAHEWPPVGGSGGGDCRSLLAKVKLDTYKGLKIGKYSRGMVQRLGIAQALLGDPELLVLDEPTSGLDPAGRKEVRDLILALKAEGKTIFLSSHILSEVEQICDRVIIINRGHMVRTGTMREMLAEGNRVEIIVDQLPEALEQAVKESREHRSVTGGAPRSHRRGCRAQARPGRNVVGLRLRRSQPHAHEEFARRYVPEARRRRRRAVNISTAAIRTIALSTFGSFLRNKVILLFGSLFLCIVLLMMTPLLAYKAMTNPANAQQMQGLILNEVAAVISMVSAFGSLLAAWAAADSVAGEMKSGTILAVMARPLRRWEFLAGKYLGVLMLMAVYVVAMLGVTFLLAWLGGQSFHASLLDADRLSSRALRRPGPRSQCCWSRCAAPDSGHGRGRNCNDADPRVFASASRHIPAWLRLPVHLTLPLTGLLSEERFLVITKASLKPFPWTSHLTILAYGLDSRAAMFSPRRLCLLQRRSLARRLGTIALLRYNLSHLCP